MIFSKSVWLFFLSFFPAVSVFTQTATICLTYDDGLPSHQTTVIPQLDSFNFKATFFLPSFTGASTQIGEASPVLTGWRNAALHGHELANHTLFHPCPEQLGWAPALSIERYSLDQLIQEITTQNALLRAFDTTRKQRSYAYPCNNTVVAGKDYAAVLQQRKLFRFARAGGDSNSVVTDIKKVPLMKVPSWLVEEGTTLEQLIRFAEKARAAGGLAVYQFHGIGAEFFRVDAATHRAFLAYLAAHPNWYHVRTFSDALRQL
jgi:peptidoglycan/xylan/chitin deacetylase (PgdA/CDA1 family)